MATSPTRSHGRKAIRATATPRALTSQTSDPADAWTAQIITLFPELFPGSLGASLIGRALEDGLWRMETIDLRRFGVGRHRNVDDTPFGGGAGMVLRPDVVAHAVAAARQSHPSPKPLIYLSPRGRPLTQRLVRSYAEGSGVTLICGRFEGLDERVIEAFGIEEVSLGDFVLTGGEIAAQALIDASVRLIPRVLGNQASLEEESFSTGLLEHPHYTKPADWEGRVVPDILLSGHHGRISDWRREIAERLTKERRPDLWRAYRACREMDPVDDQELSAQPQDAGSTRADKG